VHLVGCAMGVAGGWKYLSGSPGGGLGVRVMAGDAALAGNGRAGASV
jgi:hypothetical protein